MTAQIFLYGQIGDQSAGLDAKTVIDQVRSATGDIDVFINSTGGLVFDGLPMFEALRAYTGGQVVVHIDGFALSMASLIAMAGNRIIMASSALMMIHRPWDAAFGNADDMRAKADQVDKIEAQLVAIYAGRSGMPPAEVAALMAAETWFTAEEALAAGLITEISEPMRAVALADLSALGFRNPPVITKGKIMHNNAQAGQNAATLAMSAEEVREIRALIDAHGLSDSLATDIFRRNLSMDAARAAILSALADASDSYQASHNLLATRMGGDTFDNPAFFGQSLTNLLYARMSGKPPEGAARELANMTMVDLAREMIARNGVRNAHRMRADDVLAAASWAGPRASRGGGAWLGATARNSSSISHTTSDFPGLLLDAGQRYLKDMYQSAESGLKAVSRERTARDFRTLSSLSLSNFGTLENLPEGAEFRQGTFSERKEGFAVATYGKMFTITRQAIVNDDLGAFSDMFRIMGRAAAETEAQLLASLVNSNPNMSDGNALFSAGHANIVTSGGPPSVAEMDKLRQLLRNQRDLDGTTVLNLRAAYLVVPSQLETAASNLALGSWSPIDAANANPFAGLVKVVVEPRLSSATQWYVFADPLLAPVLEHAYLDGFNGPQIETREGWTSLGQEYRVFMHFGAGFSGWDGAARNSGVA